MSLFRDVERFFSSLLAGLADSLSFLGSHRWAAAIVLVTVIIQTALLPLAIKQFHSMRAMQRLQPEMKRLQQKYRKDKQRQQQELMELYKREGVNPAGGCLLMLPQIPVFFAMFGAIRHLTGDGGVQQMPFLGLGDLTDAAKASAGGWLLILVMIATQLLSTKQMSTAQNPQQQRMMMMMPLVFGVILINYAAGLVLYWAAQGLYRYVQQAIMLRAMKLPEPPGAKPSKGAKPPNGAKPSKGAKPAKGEKGQTSAAKARKRRR